MKRAIRRTLYSRSLERAVGWSSVALLAGAGLVGLLIAPADSVQGDVQRLMYVHVPSAWIAYLAFFVVFVASIAYLVSKKPRWDDVAHASTEIGVVFTGLAIVLGALWGKPIWGTWWTWDPRLTTTALLLLIYIGCLEVRRLPDHRAQGAKWGAVVGIMGFLNVPIVHMSVVWWRSLHQPPSALKPGAPLLAGSMFAALMLALLAFMALYLYLLLVRTRVARLEGRLPYLTAFATMDQTPRPVQVTNE